MNNSLKNALIAISLLSSFVPSCFEARLGLVPAATSFFAFLELGLAAMLSQSAGSQLPHTFPEDR